MSSLAVGAVTLKERSTSQSHFMVAQGPSSSATDPPIPFEIDGAPLFTGVRGR
jgi:hypothetical protein